MADGECQFALRDGTSTAYTIRDYARLRYLQARVLRGGHTSGCDAYGFETYNAREMVLAAERFKGALRRHCDGGLLALALHDTRLMRKYYPFILDWFDLHGIALTRNNYYSFYSVYTLLNGPEHKMLFDSRRILVITSLPPGREASLRAGLERRGARQVQFLPISASKALFDDISVEDVRIDPELVLIGAGIGSVSILEQLRCVSAVCIDAGFCLSTIANPALRYQRPYCVPDSEMDTAQIAF